MNNKKTRAFLKWAGGKYALIEQIKAHLPEGKKLVEPFVGAGSVFLNTDFDSYLLCDINADLINLYKILKSTPDRYIAEAEKMFSACNNHADKYYDYRQEFNDSTDPFRRSVLFLYLNRYGYNGLCRYNLSGKFNVPFGRYKAPYFPEHELMFFASKAKKARFECLSFSKSFGRARKGSVIYCDPPYAPISSTANFTSYAANGFSLNEQKKLAKKAEIAAFKRGIPVLISNHETEFTNNIYHKANLSRIQVSRFISQNGSRRGKVAELLATYTAKEA